MAGVAERLGHTHWSGCSRLKRSASLLPMSSASYLPLPKVSPPCALRQCTFLGESLDGHRSPLSPCQIPGLGLNEMKQSPPPFRKSSAAWLRSSIRTGSCGGRVSKRCVRAASVAETGTPTENEAAQERPGLGAGARTLLLWQARSKPGRLATAPLSS